MAIDESFRSCRWTNDRAIIKVFAELAKERIDAKVCDLRYFWHRSLEDCAFLLHRNHSGTSRGPVNQRDVAITGFFDVASKPCESHT